MDCPSCHITMSTITHNGITMDVCTGCQSVFFDEGELTEATQARADIEGWFDQEAGSRQSVVSGRSCARCGQSTKIVTSDVLSLDHCQSCGGLFIGSQDVEALFGALGKGVPGPLSALLSRR